jgi:hypothetical protein
MVDISQLMTCFCKTREVQSLYTNLLNNKEITLKEREIIIELIQCAAKSSSQIQNLCIENDTTIGDSNE